MRVLEENKKIRSVGRVGGKINSLGEEINVTDEI